MNEKRETHPLFGDGTETEDQAIERNPE